MDILGNILYLCTLLHIICEHLHDLYTLNSLSGWKGLKKFIPRDSFTSSLYILFSMFTFLILNFNMLSISKILVLLFAYAKMDSGMHDRLSENWCRENQIIFKTTFSMKWCFRAWKVIKHKCVKYTCSMETVQQNGRFTLFF